MTIASIRSWLSDVITSTRFMPGSRFAHAGDVDVHARAGLGRGLRRRARDARGAEVLHADREPGIEQLEARLDEPLLLVGVAHLHRRALRLVDPSSKPADASTLAPPMPSRPVDEPSSTARLPTPSALASTSRSTGSTPRQSTLTSGLSR